MKIYDCFPFNNEINVLDLRISYLWDTVDYFVIAESQLSFSGISKSLNAAKFVADRGLPQDKFIFVNYEFPKKMIDDFEKTGDRWPLERYARQSIRVQIALIEKNDFVILSDVDEIPSIEQIKIALKKPDYILRLSTPLFYGKMNWCALHGSDWATVRIGSAYLFEDLNKIRYLNDPVFNQYQGGHYSDLYTSAAEPKAKVRDLAHSEYDVEGDLFSEILKFSMEYRVNHFGLFFRRGFGVNRLMLKEELNDQQLLMLDIEPNYFDFSKSAHKWHTRVVASYEVTKAWQNKLSPNMPKRVRLTFCEGILRYFWRQVKYLMKRIFRRLMRFMGI